jgi:cytidine deaminase
MSTGEGVAAADLELVRRATEIVDRCGDGRVHTVAAAARAGDGLIVTGVNLYHFTGGPCAEMVLLGNAAELGVGPLEAIVAVADRTRGVLPPCGRCRQVLLDYQPGVRVLVPVDGGLESVPIAELLPFGFRWTVESGSVPAGDRRKFS